MESHIQHIAVTPALTVSFVGSAAVHRCAGSPATLSGSMAFAGH
jgi:hypothetical protein